MTKEDLKKLIHAFISFKMDYCNGVLTGLPKKDHQVPAAYLKFSRKSSDQNQRDNPHHFGS